MAIRAVAPGATSGSRHVPVPVVRPDKQGPATCEVVECRVSELVVNDEASPVPLRSNGF